MPSQLIPSKPQIYRSLEETPFTFIKTSSQLYTLAKRLESEPEIAIDLESHSYRSFQVFPSIHVWNSFSRDLLALCKFPLEQKILSLMLLSYEVTCRY